MATSPRRRAASTAGQRWIVLDVETSGLDATADSLIAVGAVCMRSGGSIVPHDSFEIVLRQEQPSSRSNIVIHGLGAALQRNGIEPREALQSLPEITRITPGPP